MRRTHKGLVDASDGWGLPGADSLWASRTGDGWVREGWVITYCTYVAYEDNEYE